MGDDRMTGLGQGIDELCAALYHDEARPAHYLGGAEARMLYDAANRIRQLETELLETRHALTEARGVIHEAVDRMRPLMPFLLNYYRGTLPPEREGD